MPGRQGRGKLVPDRRVDDFQLVAQPRQPRVEPRVQRDPVRQRVPHFDLGLELRQEDVLVNVGDHPGRGEVVPRVENLDERFRVAAVPGDDGAPDSWHERLPEQRVERIHLLKKARNR